MSLQFSGHDSFVCKNLWLKKGFDFIRAKKSFTDDLSVVELGVGKNMVTAVSYWLKAYGIMEDSHRNAPTEIGRALFKEDGYDPYLENIGSIWLLHYLLVKTGKASIYNLFFNEFRKGRFEFTKEQLSNFLLRKVENENKASVSHNTISTDIAVFIRNYLQPQFRHRKVDVEDEFSNLMIDLQLMTSKVVENAEGESIEWYEIENNIRYDLPHQIVLFTILDNPQYGNSISFQELLTGYDSPGSVFALSEEGLYRAIEAIKDSYYESIAYTETAGIRELQFKKEKSNPWRILHDYYKN